MNWLWIPVILAAAGLLFLWPVHFGTMVPVQTPVDLWFKEGNTGCVCKLKPGSEGYGEVMELLDRVFFHRTPAGLFGDCPHDPQCPRITLICGDCAVTVRTDGTVCVDGRSYTMPRDRSKTLVEAVKKIVCQ